MINNIKWIICLTLLFHYSCQDIVSPDEPDNFGLPVVELRITSEFLGILNTNIFNKRDVPAKITINDTSWNILVRYSGQTSINRLKKSYNLEFPEGKFFRGHREYKMSAQTGDPTALNPTTGPFAFRQAGLHTPSVEAAVLYLNGRLQGLYFLIEPIDEDFFEKRGQNLGTLYEATRAEAQFTYSGGYDVRLGYESRGEKRDFFGELERLLVILDESTTEELPSRLEPLLDIENYLHYLAVSVLIHNSDGYFNNFRLHLDPAIGKFQFFPWDFDRLFVFDGRRSTIRGANNLSKRLLEVTEYRHRYRDILTELMNSKLTADMLDRTFDNTVNNLSSAYEADRFLSASGVSMTKHAQRIKERNRLWYDKIQADLTELD